MADNFLNSTGLAYFWGKIKAWVSSLVASDSAYGMVKLNPAQLVTLNADGQLEVGGRLGQSPDGGIYAPATIEPRLCGAGSLLITEATGTFLKNKMLAVTTGASITLTGSHPAGSTTYTIPNTFENRIKCAQWAPIGGLYTVATTDEASSASYTVPVTSVKLGTANVSGSVPTNEDTSALITITTDGSANPDKAVTQLRLYLMGGGYSDVYAGQAAGGNGGCSVVVGQNVFSYSGNANNIVSASTFNKGNGNALFGRLHISMRNRWFMAGSGHDNRNGRSEAGAAVGQYSLIDAHTLFVVGDGTSQTQRHNAFEVTDDEGAVMPLATIDELVLKSPNGTKYKLTVADDGTLSTTAL